jgi:glycosyltransferase involved in cell wall biosynthesis
MKRILYYGMSGNMGGIESFVINMYRHIDHTRFQIDFLAFTDDICFQDEFIKNGSKIYQMPSRSKHFFSYCNFLYRFFLSHPEYQIIHMQLNNCSCIEPAVFAHFGGRKVIVHSHNDWKGIRKISVALNSVNKKIIPKVSDEFLACSEAAGKCMFPYHTFTVVHNAIELEKYRFREDTRRVYRERLKIGDRFVVGHIGRFHEQKNPFFLLDVFYEMHLRDQNSVLLMVGDGELRTRIELKIRELRLEDCVILTGVRNDVAELMQAMDVFVFPSLYEGLPVTLVEAQAAGLPCIVSEAVPKEACLTQLVRRIPLPAGPEVWAKDILEYRKSPVRMDTTEQIEAAGYGVKTAAKQLKLIYCRMLKNEL